MSIKINAICNLLRYITKGGKVENDKIEARMMTRFSVIRLYDSFAKPLVYSQYGFYNSPGTE